jgi:23S rRNA (guanosine2251-2'-O)-methyltransferase
MKNQVFYPYVHTLVLVNIRSVHNVGSLFRTGECFGVQHLCLVGYTPHPKDRFGRMRADLAKVALGAEQILSWSSHDTLDDALVLCKKNHLTIIGLEQDREAQTLEACTLDQSCALVLGEEVSGLTSVERAQCDILVEIPLYGTKESLNVSVAGALALYVLTHQN